MIRDGDLVPNSIRIGIKLTFSIDLICNNTAFRFHFRKAKKKKTENGGNNVIFTTFLRSFSGEIGDNIGKDRVRLASSR